MQALYTAHATATGGRDGRAVSDNQALDVALSTPKELGGAGGAGTNPEQLFAAGYSACFLSALKLVASQSKTALPATASISAAVGVGPNGNGGFAISAVHLSLVADIPGNSIHRQLALEPVVRTRAFAGLCT